MLWRGGDDGVNTGGGGEWCLELDEGAEVVRRWMDDGLRVVVGGA